MQRAWIPVPNVAEEIRLDVPLRKEFLLTAETGLAGGKELLVHLGMIEAGHGPAIETECPRGHDRYAPCRLEFRLAVVSTISGLLS